MCMTGQRYMYTIHVVRHFSPAHYLVVGLDTSERESVIVDAPLVGKRFTRRRVSHEPRLLARRHVKGQRLHDVALPAERA